MHRLSHPERAKIISILSLRRTGNRHIKRQCGVCGHTYSTRLAKHMLEMHMRIDGELERYAVPETPFYGDPIQLARDCYIYRLS